MPIAEFEIADTGVGIPPEDLERVFQPFERGNAPSVRSVPGTGLGLTITKLLTHIMGGEIVARSMPGLGTTFTVRLLLTEAAHSPVETSARRIVGYEGAPVTVLMIDDDPTHLDIVQSLLRPLNFTVFSTSDGRSGIELAKECKPDIALVDISMPEMSGWDVVKALRNNCVNGRLKIVMVSANAHEYSPGGENELHDGFVMKPIDVQTLLAAMASVLRLKWQYEVAHASPAAEVSLSDHRLSSEQIAELYQLGRIGHVRGIQAKLNEVESADPANAAFAAHLRELIGKFEFKRYLSVLNEFAPFMRSSSQREPAPPPSQGASST
jgi:CheY-like chemotaxis protein